MSAAALTDAGSPLARLIGTWDFEAGSDGRFLGRGVTTFEWMEGGAFVLQRADDEPDPRTSEEWAAHSPMPVTAVIGWDDTTGELAQLYSDARGVFRIYRMTLTEVAWTAWRDAPGFFQRFIGRIGDDGSTIEGRWESSPDGGGWEPDFEMLYRKRRTGEIKGVQGGQP
jgi:hypothetical protein